VLHHFKNRKLQQKMQLLAERLKTQPNNIENAELMFEIKKQTEINIILGNALNRVV
jgi:hypothetical protein